MANYALVANSVFQPFTYQELAAPLDREELYHERLAQEYDNLSSQADLLEMMGANDRDKNSGSYSKYKAYSDSLRNEADNLYRYGLNVDSRQRLSDLRRRYNTDIVPIQNAWKKREQEATTQQQAILNNPHLMFTRDADKTTLDEYIKNPLGGYGVVNGASITSMVSQMAGSLAKKIRAGEKVDIDPYTYDYIRKYGLTEDLIRDWRNNPTLSKMFEQAMKANGVTPEALKDSMNAQSIIDRSTNYAEMGMWSAIGQDQAQTMDNFKAREDYKFGQQVAMENLRHAHSMAQARAANGGDNNPIIPSGPSDYVKESYGNAKAAGTSARNQLANLTADFVGKYLREGKGKGLVQEGGIRKIVNYLKMAGDRGLDLTSPTMLKVAKVAPDLYPSLRKYLHQNFKAENGAKHDTTLVDMWLSAAANANPGPTERQREEYERHKRYIKVGRDPYGNSKKFVKEYEDKYVNGNGKRNSPTWDDFDKKAHNGYFMYLPRYNDNQQDLGNWLEDVVVNQMQSESDKVPLYEFKGTANDGRAITGGKKFTLNDLPQDKQGNIKWEKIHTVDHGVDKVVSWVKDGKTHKAVLRSEDMGTLANDDRMRISNQEAAARRMYERGEISKADYDKISQAASLERAQQHYGMYQPTKSSAFDPAKVFGFSDYSEEEE